MKEPSDGWQPHQYQRFRSERAAPFFDLAGLLVPVPGGRVIDFGCGTGELTAELHRRLQAATTIGIDRSPAMLAEAVALAGGGLDFRPGDLRRIEGLGPVDVVFSNAALHWVPDHPAVLAVWSSLLPAGGQLAVQVPANADHPAHLIAAEVAEQPPFADALGDPPPDPVRSVLRPEEYATHLDQLGFADQHVRLQVYGHRLASTGEVVEWVKGTSLVRFRERLPEELFDQFVERYRGRLLEVLGDQRPFFYPFKRILMWARR